MTNIALDTQWTSDDTGATTDAIRVSARSTSAVRRWLIAVALMVAAIILVGGATRLTESGLSITEWKPVTGVLPPLDVAQWNVEFEKYKRIPQYVELNDGMSLASFKRIYLWEYSHRLLARVVGLAFVLPLLVFALRGQLPRSIRTPVFLMLVLFAVQAAMGWWMVKSGLTQRTEVSQYRLALHLCTALILLAVMVWTAAGLSPYATRVVTLSQRGRRRLSLLVMLVFTTAASGALVAGLRAGRIYNSLPYMGASLVPAEYGSLDPWWRNLFDNPAAVQFNHRLLATLTFVTAIVCWVTLRRSSNRLLVTRMHLVLGAVFLQFALGIATLLLAVPISLGVMHQGGLVLLLVTVLLARHVLRVQRPSTGRSASTP